MYSSLVSSTLVLKVSKSTAGSLELILTRIESMISAIDIVANELEMAEIMMEVTVKVDC